MITIFIMSSSPYNKDYDYGRGLHKKDCDHDRGSYYERIAILQFSQNRSRSCGALRSRSSHEVAVAVVDCFQLQS